MLVAGFKITRQQCKAQNIHKQNQQFAARRIESYNKISFSDSVEHISNEIFPDYELVYLGTNKHNKSAPLMLYLCALPEMSKLCFLWACNTQK